jgi:adhesin transport system membrane fusion protein
MALLKRVHPDDAEFMSEISAATLESGHRLGHSLLFLTFAFFIAAGWWASETELDEVTRGDGKVIPSSKVQVIQNLEGGILAEVLVAEGETVNKNQVLLKIDDTRFASSFRETKLKYWELLARTARLEAESEGKEFVVPVEVQKEQPVLAANETSLFTSRKLELESTIRVLKQQEQQRRQELVERRSKQQQLERSFSLSNQELKMSEPLVAQGVMSEVELLRLKRTVNDLRGDMDGNRLVIPRIQATLNEVRQKIDEQEVRFKTDAAAQLSEVRAELARTKEMITSHKDRVT